MFTRGFNKTAFRLALATMTAAGIGIAAASSASAAAPTGTWVLGLRVLHTNYLTKSMRITYHSADDGDATFCTQIAAGQSQTVNMTGYLSTYFTIESYSTNNCTPGTLTPNGVLNPLTPSVSGATINVVWGRDHGRIA
jgi:hypothetical protein